MLPREASTPFSFLASQSSTEAEESVEINQSISIPASRCRCVPYTRGCALHFHCNSSNSKTNASSLRLSPPNRSSSEPSPRHSVIPLTFFFFHYFFHSSLLLPSLSILPTSIAGTISCSVEARIIEREFDRLRLLSFDDTLPNEREAPIK